MKSLAKFTIRSAALCLLAVSAYGVLSETTPAPKEQDTVKINPVEQPKIAFLGVVTSPLTQIMTEQLGLPPGEGVIIHAVAPESPAAKAGIAANDIITAINGQSVISPLDLSKTMTAKKPGDPIHLKMIQKGKPAECDVTLGSRPAGLEKMRAESLENALKKLRESGSNNPEDKDLQATLVDMLAARNSNEMELQMSATIRVIDDQGCVEMKSNKNIREIIVRDKEDKVTWSGLWNSEAEKNAAPAEIRQRLKDLNIDRIFDSNHLRVKIRGAKPDTAPEKSRDADVPEK